ncbi:RICIN domain-containing protein [Sphingomonas canadensis]|uniref:RICIN domain-containing protein n=1 Tax=Sphingomonas canadensis TaxID=1219257 RepID=A0ABW3H2W2_9SPHN|nr:hypothetical protein [Sphingomonas canadensis]MCW3834581.1 hypothetical protein [Sphingomonas canadensis]
MRLRDAMIAAILACWALPAAAQPVYVAPAGSSERPQNGVVAATVDASRPPVPETGTADYRIETSGGKCLVPQMRDNQVYLLRPGACVDGVLLNARFHGNQRARLELDRSGSCVAVRRRDFDGSGLMYRTWADGLAAVPCTDAIELRYRIDWAGDGLVSIRTADGKCWTVADTGILVLPCDRSAGQRFRLLQPAAAGRVAPDGRVQPATGAAPAPAAPSPAVTLPVITPPPPPRAPATGAERMAALPRPAGLPANAPPPARYWLFPAGREGACVRVTGTGAAATVRLGRDCTPDPDSLTQLDWTGPRGFRLANLEPAGLCFVAGKRPWITAEACTPADAQHFTIEPAGFRDYWVIKTAGGLCLAVRGKNDIGTGVNNSALFPEPCRAAGEQYFELYPQED